MSADNIIFVKREGRKWLVWEDTLSNENPKPTKRALKFADKNAALKKAEDMETDTFVEYGISFYEGEGSIRKQNRELRGMLDDRWFEMFAVEKHPEDLYSG